MCGIVCGYGVAPSPRPVRDHVSAMDPIRDSARFAVCRLAAVLYGFLVVSVSGEGQLRLQSNFRVQSDHGRY